MPSDEAECLKCNERRQGKYFTIWVVTLIRSKSHGYWTPTSSDITITNTYKLLDHRDGFLCTKCQLKNYLYRLSGPVITIGIYASLLYFASSLDDKTFLLVLGVLALFVGFPMLNILLERLFWKHCQEVWVEGYFYSELKEKYNKDIIYDTEIYAQAGEGDIITLDSSLYKSIFKKR